MLMNSQDFGDDKKGGSMQKKDELGVLIEVGPQDWQIYQRGTDDTATIYLAGRWLTPQPHKKAIVAVRLVRESDGEPVLRSLNWVRATTTRTVRWQVQLADVSAGGLYRIETALQLDDGPVEWGQRGDMVHHIGVGDIWLITGQSNSEGHGKSPAPDAPEFGVHMFHARGQWALATHPLGDSIDTRYLPNRLGSNPSHSPWLVFGRTLRAELGVPVGLIPASLGCCSTTCCVMCTMPGEPCVASSGIRANRTLRRNCSRPTGATSNALSRTCASLLGHRNSR